MNVASADYLPHLLAVFLLIARIGDIGTTYLLSPNLKLEANPIIRRLRWPYAIATLLICLIPYVSPRGAVTILVASLLVSMSNSLRLWLVRTVGEDEYYQSVVEAAGRAKPRQSVVLLFLPGVFMSLLAFTIFLFYPNRTAIGDFGLLPGYLPMPWFFLSICR